jgi:ubiquinone/menaquinone biosynthesis C-methylase UbiE
MKQEEKSTKEGYNALANNYHNLRNNGIGKFFNNMLEMPATLGFLGNVKGKKILDWGCGTGIYAKILTKKGAIVKGFDISEELIKIAKTQNPNLDLKIGSGYKIPFNEKFDIVFASLAINYVKDWNKVFFEIKRVLNKNGIFIFSFGNPITEISKKKDLQGKRIRIIGDYFTERKIEGLYEKIDEKEIQLWNYHRTYESIIKTILKNDFEIIDYKDCYPLKKAKKLFPFYYDQYSKIPNFCVWKVRKK